MSGEDTRRWELRGDKNPCTSPSAIVTVVDGPWVPYGESVEVCPVALLAEAVWQRDRMVAIAEAELARLQADLDDVASGAARYLERAVKAELERRVLERRVKELERVIEVLQEQAHEFDSTEGGMIYLDGKPTGHKMRHQTERRVMERMKLRDRIADLEAELAEARSSAAAEIAEWIEKHPVYGHGDTQLPAKLRERFVRSPEVREEESQ